MEKQGFDMRAEATRIISALTTAQKARLLAGADYWSTASVPFDECEDASEGIPSFALTDGPNGVRKQVASFDNMGLAESLPATCFPSACTSACTFDEGLIELMGSALGEECRAEDVAVVLAPGVNIKRHPLGGRNFEYFSEDPHLSGRLGAAFVKGVQKRGAGACVKHMSANSQETRRMTSDSVIDEATLNDIYLKPFETVVREAHPAAVMPAYNRLNGKYCAENPELLGKLREQWGFSGLVVSDWGGMSDSTASVAAGMDLCMPGPRPDHLRAIEEAVQNGDLSKDALDKAATNVASAALAHKLACGSGIACSYDNGDGRDDIIAEHAAIAQLVAEAGTVLLKNDGALPLARGSKVAVIGGFAKKPRYQGSGSSKVNPVILDCAWDALVEDGWEVSFAEGFDADTGVATESQAAEAARLAAQSDIALVFAGLPDALESEGFDRDDMALPETMNLLIGRVAEANPNSVVVLSGGGCVEMPWKESVNAIVATHLSGCRSGHAATNVLTGKVNPSGRLAETWPDRIEDTALGLGFPVDSATIPYIEGPFVGYRYYQAAGVGVAYPFGHGLSYTDFEYSGLAIVEGESGYIVELDLANTGGIDGYEVVQIYLARKESALPTPPRELVAFKRVFIEAGRTTHLSIPLGFEAFSRWDPEAGGRVVERGIYGIEVGASSEDIRAHAQISIGEAAPFPTETRNVRTRGERDALASYYDVKPHGFRLEGFMALYGHPLPKPPDARPFTMNSRIADLKETPTGRRVFEIIERTGRRLTVDDDASHKMLERTFGDMPIRLLLMGKVPHNVVEALLHMMNKRPLVALRTLLFGE